MSKFLRQMAALSKKPSDYPKQESVPNTVLGPPTDSIRDTEAVTGTESVAHAVPISAKVSVPPAVSTPRTDFFLENTPQAAPTRPRRPRPRPARLAQDGHSHAEQAVYAALWDAGVPQADGNRTVVMGLGRLSRAARLSENNCRI